MCSTDEAIDSRFSSSSLFSRSYRKCNATVPLQPHSGAAGVAVVLLIFVVIAREMNAVRVAAFGTLVAVKDQVIVHIVLCELDQRSMPLSLLGFCAG